MRIVIESFVVLANLFVLAVQCVYLIQNALKTPFSTKYQRIHQMCLLSSLLFLISYQYKLLKTTYSRQVWDFDNSTMTGKIKLLQYIAENILRFVVLLALNIILNSTDKMKVQGIKDNEVFRICITAYSFIRIIPVIRIITMFTGKVSFESFIMELFLIGEGVVIVLSFVLLRKSLGKMKAEVSSGFLPDKSYLEYVLGRYELYSYGFIGALSIEVLARTLFLFIMLEHRTRTLMFLKDFGNLLRIISIYVLTRTLNDLIFIDYAQDISSSSKNGTDQDQQNKFFVFEDESNEDVVDLKKQ